MKLKKIFVTATGTGVGKTKICSSIVRRLRKEGVRAIAVKPFLSGSREDAEILDDSNDKSLPMELLNPFYFSHPLAPYASSKLDGNEFEWCKVVDYHEKLDASLSGKADLLLIEGVGGWLVPLTREHFVRDWARQISAKLLLVAPISLGTINHTLLTLESIRNSGLDILAVILNNADNDVGIAAKTNPEILGEFISCPIFQIGFGHGADEMDSELCDLVRGERG